MFEFLLLRECVGAKYRLTDFSVIILNASYLK